MAASNGGSVGPRLAPASEAALVSALGELSAAGAKLACEGNGTKRQHGPAVDAAARTISLRGLTALTAYEPGDMVVVAQAGMRLVDLQRVLAVHNQWLPIDPPYADATLGGILATASAGPRRFGHGTLKDYILGLRTAGADGVVTKSGGRVVKNVTGYDLHRLHIGAFGTLGVLVEVNLKVVPRPDVVAVAAIGFADLAAAHRRMLEVASSRLRPVALEVLDGAAAEVLRRARPDLPAGQALALIGIEGTRPVFDRHCRDLNLGASAVFQGASAEGVWAAVRDLRAAFADAVVVRIGARPHDLPALLSEAGLGRLGAGATMAHAGTGIARVALPADDVDGIVAALRAPRAAAGRVGGYAVVESAPLRLPGRARLPWRASDDRRPLDEMVRQAWDLGQRLNPGRMAI